MLCDICHTHEAKVHIQEIIDGVKTTVHLCTECAAANGMLKDDHATLDLSAMVCKITASTLGASQAGNDSGDSSPAITCPVCGLTDIEFRSVKRLGCPACYDAFAELLHPIMAEIHRGTRHTGLTPGETLPAASDTAGEQLQFLHRELDRAVASEAYEQAAELRDRIRRMTTADDKGGDAS